jgi:hypothetical protein
MPIDMAEGVDLEEDPNALDYPSDATDDVAGASDESVDGEWEDDGESDDNDDEDGANGAACGEQVEVDVAALLAATMDV